MENKFVPPDFDYLAFISDPLGKIEINDNLNKQLKVIPTSISFNVTEMFYISKLKKITGYMNLSVLYKRRLTAEVKAIKDILITLTPLLPHPSKKELDEVINKEWKNRSATKVIVRFFSIDSEVLEMEQEYLMLTGKKVKRAKLVVKEAQLQLVPFLREERAIEVIDNGVNNIF